MIHLADSAEVSRLARRIEDLYRVVRVAPPSTDRAMAQALIQQQIRDAVAAPIDEPTDALVARMQRDVERLEPMMRKLRK